MGKLAPRERAAIIKRQKEINAKISDPRLTIEEYDTLHKEREELHKKLLDDRAG